MDVNWESKNSILQVRLRHLVSEFVKKRVEMEIEAYVSYEVDPYELEPEDRVIVAYDTLTNPFWRIRWRMEQAVIDGEPV